MCDNFVVMADFNIDVKLEEFCNFFDLSNLIKSNTCFTETHSSKIKHLFHKNTQLENQTLVSQKHTARKLT